ncbi:MAG: hypothetical protein Q9227_009092 [Pyrenula ochraceoflavens]
MRGAGGTEKLKTDEAFKLLIPTRVSTPSIRTPAGAKLSPETGTTMGLAYNVYLNSNKIFGCKRCKTHLANYEDIISRVRVLLPNPPVSHGAKQANICPPEQNFRGQHGKAYLFTSVVNIKQAEAMERSMTTGRHVVRDILCRQCNDTVGWKYDKAYEASEKYKEGKFILEAELLQIVY